MNLGLMTLGRFIPKLVSFVSKSYNPEEAIAQVPSSRAASFAVPATRNASTMRNQANL